MATRAGREAWQLISEMMFNGELQDRFHEASAAAGVTPGLLKSLIHLDQNEGLPMREMADHFGCDASYVTTIVDGLEERGLALRRPHPTDRRVKSVVLTDAGVQAREQALERLYQPPAALDALTGDEQRMLRDLMRKVAAADPTLESARRGA